MPKARILAVDDQLYFRVFLEDLLAQEGYEVRTATQADEALAAVESERFDAVLTDLAMPGMSGLELVQVLRERSPDLPLIVITSVGDVKTAVEAMKVGADDYLLKPIDRNVLSRSIDGLLERRQLAEEHASLLAENLEFMGAVSLYERALGLHSRLQLEPLADRIVDGLCLETHAQGGVLWLQRPDDPGRLRLMGARGLVRVQEEAEEVELEALPEALEPLRTGEQAGFEAVWGGGGEREGLFLPLRLAERLLGFARLTDRLDHGEFDEFDRAAAVKFASFAAQAVANALERNAVERRSFRDPVTKAYTRAYFEDVVRNEHGKALRFGRSFSMLRVELDGTAALRGRLAGVEYDRWLEGVAYQLGRCLRATDLLAAESQSRFCALLPETDALGAAILARRLRAGTEGSSLLQDLSAEERPQVLVASASFPTDGDEPPALWSVLEDRLEQDRQSLARSLDLTAASFGATATRLLADGRPGRPETVEQIARFLVAEIARHPQERGLLFVSPGASLTAAVREGFESLRGLAPRTEIVLVAERPDVAFPGLPVSHVTPARIGTPIPFLLYFGEGAPYAVLRGPGEAGESISFYHTSDRVLVEQLAFQLGRDLGIPIGQ